MRWLWPKVLFKEQIVETIMVEHYTTILPFKLKNWVLCSQLGPFKETFAPMEVYASAEAGLYLILKPWKKKVVQTSRGGHKPEDWGCGEEIEQTMGKPESLPPRLTGHAKPRGAAAQCFTYGQLRHFQCNCSHMDCSLIKSLSRISWGF